MDYITPEPSFNNFSTEINFLMDAVEKIETDKVEVSFDPQIFKVESKLPVNVDEDIINQLSNLFDHNNTFQKVIDKGIGPNTSDRIREALAVVYILENGVVVAGAILVDPTKENYKGIIPKDYYELKSGVSLNGKIQQDFFIVSPDKHDLGLAQELKKKLGELSKEMFVIVPSTDTDTVNGLRKNRYTYVSSFFTDWEEVPVQLWIN